MKMNRYIYSISFGIALLLTSCGIPKLTQREGNITLPGNYNETSIDTTSASILEREYFFKDPQLLALIDSALVNNQEVNMLLQRIEIAKNEINIRKGEYLPFIGLQAGADIDKSGSYTRNGSIERSLEIKPGEEFPEPLPNFGFGLTASWELDIWKKLRNAKKASVLEYLASTEGKNFLVTNLVSEIADSYYELMALDNQLVNLEKNIEIQKNALEIVKLLKDAARTTSLAVKRFEAEVHKNQSEIYMLKQKITETENRIKVLVGDASANVVRNSVTFMELEPDFINSGIPANLLTNRPDVKQAELELQAAKLNIKVARANFFPRIDLKAGIGFQSFNPGYLLITPESLAYSIAGDIVAPLINRNAIKATYKNAGARQIETAYEYEKVILHAFTEVVNQLSSLDNLEKSYELKQKQVEALTASIEISNQLFQSARADYMEVLLTQRDALEARMELIETKKDQLTSTVKLYKALGGGWK